MRRSRFAKFHALASLSSTASLSSELHAQQTIAGQTDFADWRVASTGG
ncbi:MAG TPA: hypothetical protein VK638_26665 [Edaphobacter sp.]|jgi:hypothetical protein|nr:hypothetical protein [Edaphobacter sp.]